MDKVLKTCLSPALDDNYLSKNNASTQVLYLNKRILSEFFQNENCWVVTFEVTNDINAFEEYLRHGIFEAAGFESYCIQELRGLVDIFREKEGTWAGVAQNEWYN